MKNACHGACSSFAGDDYWTRVWAGPIYPDFFSLSLQFARNKLICALLLVLFLFQEKTFSVFSHCLSFLVSHFEASVSGVK